MVAVMSAMITARRTGRGSELPADAVSGQVALSRERDDDRLGLAGVMGSASTMAITFGGPQQRSPRRPTKQTNQPGTQTNQPGTLWLAPQPNTRSFRYTVISV
jgi:hypothetical protein